MDVLDEFLLDKENVNRFNRLIENDECWYNESSIHTIFELIKYFNTGDEEVSKLIALNKYTYSFDEEQRDELIELAQNSKSAKNKLIQIIENHLESNYDFESLMQYLKKAERKNALNI